MIKTLFVSSINGSTLVIVYNQRAMDSLSGKNKKVLCLVTKHLNSEMNISTLSK